MPQLTCQNLTIGYEGKIVISDLSFSINTGDYLCIVGENGSGKSTLMKTVLKLKSPMTGQVIFEGGLEPGDIGYMPQQTVVEKDFPASVREVVRSGCLNRCGLRPYYSKKEKSIAEDSMGLLGVADLAKSCYRELSGGQQQRVLLARSLCAARKILLLDEPTAGLDPKTVTEIYALLANLNNESMTVIMISHDMAAVAKYSSHVLHIGDQSALFFGATADYLKSEAGRSYTCLGGELV